MAERIAWGVLALIHLIPATAFVAPHLIGRLYGIAESDPFFPLLHHRAALFAVLLLICIWAIADSNVRHLAVFALALSMLSFLGIYWMAGQPESLRDIAIADLIGLPFLAFVAWRTLTAS